MKHINLRRWALALSLAILSAIAFGKPIVSGTRGGGGSSAITSSVAVSITSGAAPLAVRFDARATTSSDSAITNLTNGGTFRQIAHAFDFGDTGAGTWAISGLSKNSENGGPIAVHVFETPGTYQVNITHSHAGTSNKAATPITITVSDPDVTYSGTSTVCIEGASVTGTGCPSGAVYFSSLTAAGGFASNKRYLFKKGQSFSSFQLGGGTLTNIRVGAYGTGAKPIFTGGTYIGGAAANTNLVLMDAEVRTLLEFDAGHHNMALRVDVLQPQSSGCCNLYGAEGESYLNMAYQYIVECTATDPSRVTNGIFYGVMSKGAFLGNDFDVAGQHVIRLTNSFGMFIAHNALKRPLPTKHAIKMHAATSGATPTVWDESSSAAANTLATSYNIVAHNIGGTVDSEQTWTFTADPQNNSGTQPEGITDVIFEGNWFHNNGDVSRKDITAGGRRITYRSNSNLDATLITDTGENSANIPSGWNGPYFNP